MSLQALLFSTDMFSSSFLCLFVLLSHRTPFSRKFLSIHFFPPNTFIVNFLLCWSLCWRSPITASVSTSYRDCGHIPGQREAFNLFLNHPFHCRKRRVTASFQSHGQKFIDVASEPGKNQKFS